MLALRLPPEMEERLEDLAQKTGRTKSYCAKKASTEFLQDKEDYLFAWARLEKNNPRLSLNEVERQLGLKD